MRILVACDGSEIGESAAAAVPTLLGSDGEVHLLTVVDPAHLHRPVPGTGVSAFFSEAAEENRNVPPPMHGVAVPASGAEIMAEDTDQLPRRAGAGIEDRGQALDRARAEHFDYLCTVASRFFPDHEPEIHIAFAEHVGPEIVRLASEVSAAVIVMGTHGRSGISKALMGSVAEQVVRTAAVPVMVVGPGTRGTR